MDLGVFWLFKLKLSILSLNAPVILIYLIFINFTNVSPILSIACIFSHDFLLSFKIEVIHPVSNFFVASLRFILIVTNHLIYLFVLSDLSDVIF